MVIYFRALVASANWGHFSKLVRSVAVCMSVQLLDRKKVSSDV